MLHHAFYVLLPGFIALLMVGFGPIGDDEEED